jgi:hypothetical protein
MGIFSGREFIREGDSEFNTAFANEFAPTVKSRFVYRLKGG